MNEEWPTPQKYAECVNPAWKAFKSQDFWYRFKAAKAKVDATLGRKYNRMILAFILLLN